MGSSASKASRAANSAARVYPARASQAATNAPTPTPAARAAQPAPTARPPPQASETKDEATNHDAHDPVFSAQLRSLGPVAANPYTSNSSTSATEPPRPGTSLPDFSTGPNPYGPPTGAALPPRTRNPALTILSAREALAAAAEAEFAGIGRRGAAGRRFLDVVELRKVLALRDERGRAAAEIERQMGLQGGVVGRLGVRGVLELV
ncbi:hypothetical protein UCRNP2_2554 [Neofusicoccum parvum UCRNP2]|uniref:Helix-turn-helix domain-containing protein n=1 Tax=Botryosphaeria parva (strain UCR-NP2) TaxID=1287680 RepID=R1GX41_BOTPV|nr:hypothetical protein UCRNP2_2554 [Neofusicoccum parvum UCRNP2]